MIIREFLVKLGFKVDPDSQKKFKEGVEESTKQATALERAQRDAAQSAVRLATAMMAAGRWLGNSALGFADKLETLHFASKRTGAAASSLKAVANAALDVGVSSQEALSSVENVARFMRNNPAGESYIAALGVQTRDVKGHLRDTVDIVNELGKALSQKDASLANQYGNILGIDELFLRGMRDPKYRETFDKARHNYVESGVDTRSDQAHRWMSRWRSSQTQFEGTVGTVGAWGSQAGMTLGTGLLSYFGAKSILQQGLGKAINAGWEHAATKATTAAAETAAKTAVTSEATGAAGWLGRLMPWVGRVGGGLALMLHSEGLNQGEEQYLAHRRPRPGQRWRPDMHRPIPDETKPQSFWYALANSAFGRLIARGEGDYNSVNRGARGGYKAGTENLGGMTVAEVMAAQRAGRFNAAGRYQIIGSTLTEAATAMGLTGSEKFDQDLQDRIFGEYLVKHKRRAIADYIEGRSDNLRAALRASAREWASVADPDTGRSYYAGKGNNRATISATEMEMALRNTRATYAVQLASLEAPNKARPVEIKQNIKINVNGTSDPVATGNAVAREQQRVNADMVRNMEGVTS